MKRTRPTDGEPVGERRRRPMAGAGRLLDPGERREPGGPPQTEGAPGEPGGSKDESGENGDPQRIGDQPPQPEPRDAGEDRGEREQRRQDRPDRLPQQDQPGAADRALDPSADLRLTRGEESIITAEVGHPSRSSAPSLFVPRPSSPAQGQRSTESGESEAGPGQSNEFGVAARGEE